MIEKTLIHIRVDEARSGSNDKVIGRMRSGWAVVGDHQVLHVYCLLLPDPVVPSLNDLSQERRSIFLEDMTILGDALLAVTGAHRINYEILGNTERALHAHLFPRYESEPKDLKTKPVWKYDFSKAKPFTLNNYAQFISVMKEELIQLGALT